MSILDAVKPSRNGKVPEVLPPDIDARLQRGRPAMTRDAMTRRLCQKFFEGDQYWFITASGGLSFQTAGMVGVTSANKPNFRIRTQHNWVGAVVEAKTSAATQRIPDYEVTPSTDDPDDQAAARLASQIATYGYDEWNLRRITTEAVTNAFVKREGFARPYFDANIGPFEPGMDGRYEGRGEVCVEVYSRDEVMWEPGKDFDKSRWHAIEKMWLKEEVRQIPGYIPGSLETDDEKQLRENGSVDLKIKVTEYLERPSARYPYGRRCFIANRKVIVDYRLDPDHEPNTGPDQWYEPYPYLDAEGEVIDSPCLHRISYTVNPNHECGDLGLVERIIDLQRTISDCWNKMLEIKNRALIPQMLAPVGSNVQRRDDTPGATFYYTGQIAPQWEQAPDPQLLAQLLQIRQAAIDELRSLAADIDVQPDPRLSADTVNAAVQNNQNRWQSFLGDLAEFHSRLMRHCLTLVARYYTQDRQIEIRGRFGWQPLQSFVGQDMRSQVNVRVLPGSLETRSRAQIQQEIQFIQANWPGAINPEAALAAIHGGSYEGLVRDYEDHIAKAWRIVRRLRSGPDGINSFGSRFEPNTPDLSQPIDPSTGQHPLGVEVPAWMPAPWDNISIWRQVIGGYMTTEDFEGMPPEVQNNFRLIWDGLTAAEQMRAAEQAAQQQVQAESLGMNNAARSPTPPPLPDRAGFTPENQSPTPSPGQQ